MDVQFPHVIHRLSEPSRTRQHALLMDNTVGTKWVYFNSDGGAGFKGTSHMM